MLITLFFILFATFLNCSGVNGLTIIFKETGEKHKILINHIFKYYFPDDPTFRTPKFNKRPFLIDLLMLQRLNVQ